MSSFTSSTNPNKHPRSPSPTATSDKKAKPSPTTPTIPPDVIALIASFADNSVRARLLQTSSANYNLVGPILYERITISRENAFKLFLGLPRSPGVHRYSVFESDCRNTAPSTAYMELQWPDISIENDHEDHDDTGEPLTMDYFPTQATYERKLKLLENVKHINVASIPDARFSKDMQGWLRLASRTTPWTASKKIFKRAVSISFHGLSMLQLAVWSLEHVDFSYHLCHPFIHFLTSIGEFNRYCFTFPTMTHTVYGSFVSDKMASKHLRSLPPLSRESLIEKKFEEIEAVCRQIMFIITPYNVDSVTLHAFMVGEAPYTSVNTKIFFANCCCTDINRVKKVSCLQYQHRIIQIIRDLSAFVSNARENNVRWQRNNPISERFELVSPSDEHMNLDPNQKIDWFDMKNEVLKTHPGWEAEDSVMVDYKYAAPCVCCGTKEGR